VVLIKTASGASIAPDASGGSSGVTGKVTFVSQAAAGVVVAAGQTVTATATVELAPPSGGSDYSLQLRICYQSGASAPVVFPDEPAFAVNSPGSIYNFNSSQIISFSREAASGSIPAGTYSVGMCALQTTGSSGGSWNSSETDPFNGSNVFQGASKVVAMVVE
jgi:hypothetical protein